MCESTHKLVSRRGAWGLCVCLCLSYAPDDPHAQQATPEGFTKVHAEGFARGTGAQSRNEAVELARKEAIRLWLEATLEGADQQYFQQISDTPDRYARSSRIVSLENTETGTLVQIEAYLDEWVLRADAAALLMARVAIPPKVVFLVGEQNIGDETVYFDADDIAVNNMTKVFELRGFEVVAPEIVRRNFTHRELLGYLYSDHTSMGKFARANGADVVIFGEVGAKVTTENQTTGTMRAHATTTLHVLRASDAQLFETAESVAEVICYEPRAGAQIAIEDAVFKVRDAALVASALASAGVAKTARHELRIENPNDWDDVENVAALLRNIAGVAQVDVLRARVGQGLIEFLYNGKMGMLVDALSVQIPGGGRLEARTVVGAELSFRIVREQP